MQKLRGHQTKESLDQQSIQLLQQLQQSILGKTTSLSEKIRVGSSIKSINFLNKRLFHFLNVF
jgi:hypothetical protein